MIMNVLPPNNKKVELKDTFDRMNDSILNSPEVKENLPCDKCDGDCCGAVPFRVSEIIDIFNKYNSSRNGTKAFKKRFPYNENALKKNVVFTQAFPNSDNIVVPTFRTLGLYLKNGLASKTTCIFKISEKTGGCLIYEDRPTICREYGKRECLRCPYSGLDEQPQDPIIKKDLIIKGHQHRNNQVQLENKELLLRNSGVL